MGGRLSPVIYDIFWNHFGVEAEDLWVRRIDCHTHPMSFRSAECLYAGEILKPSASLLAEERLVHAKSVRVAVEECDWLDRTNVILEHGIDRDVEPVDREAGFIRFEGWSLARLLDRFASARSSNLEELDALVGAADLKRRGVHPTFGEVTLAQLLATWVVHDLNHTGQIVKTMAKQYKDAVGPWREFLPIVDAP